MFHPDRTAVENVTDSSYEARLSHLVPGGPAARPRERSERWSTTAAPDGLPVLLTSHMRPVEPVCSCFGDGRTTCWSRDFAKTWTSPLRAANETVPISATTS